jgi:ABC-type phosphate transport system substrate-binding protein
MVMRKILLIAFVLPVLVYADIIVVVAKSSAVSSLSKKELKEVYLKKQQFSNGIKLVPINLPASSQIRSYFDRVTLRMEEAELGDYWNEKHYNGINPPMVQNSQEAIKAMVKKVPGAIGYIDESLFDDGLKVVATLK